MYKFWFGATHIKHAFDRGRRDVANGWSCGL